MAKTNKTMPIVSDYVALVKRANEANRRGNVELAKKLRGKAEAAYASMTAPAQRQIGQVAS